MLLRLASATWTQQSEVITREESQSILRLAKDCSSSLLGFGDVASFISETTAAISTRFEFDDVLRSTVLYQTAERSHLKQAIQAKRTNIKRISTDNTSRRSTISGTRHAFPRIKLSQPIKENDVLDNQQGNRLNSQSELTVDPSRGNGSGRDKDPPQQNLVNDSKQPTRPPLNKSESSFGHWRRALQRRISSATDIKPYQNQQDGNSQPEGTKVLLLGVSGCGKTTLINALHLFAGTDHITNNGGHYRAMIWQNALDAVGILFKEPLLKQIFHNWHLLYTYPALVPKEARQLASAIVNSRRSVNFQLELKASTDYQFENNAKYYIENIDRLAEQAIHLSAPTHGDVLRTRVTTTGINQTVLEYGGTQYLLHDVGGDSRKLKGWVGAYEHVATIIFPVDIIGYRREVGVGIYVDRMQEQINLWKSVVNNRWFKNASFLVVFTRMDLINKYLKLEETRYSLSKRGVLTTVEDYLGYLEEMFSKLIDWRHITDEPWQVRVRFVRANYNKGR
ncbi:hypothetical protein RRF57_013289 [Xylaria bambusicola]|uniref:G domain-containing protein n=1 Tax=Xylaria bambusicola TaxID=326684 RepID=A0AAN7V550_9PEZI